MKIVSTSYVNSPGFSDPEQWLDRISFYTGILEELAKDHIVESIEQINYSGVLKRNGVTYHFLNFKKPIVYFPLKLHRYIKKLLPDIVFVNGFIFPLQIIQLRFALGRRVKIIVINHAEKPGSGIRKILQRLSDRFINTYFFTAKEMGDEWVQQGIIACTTKVTEVMEASSSFYTTDKEKPLAVTGVKGNPVFLWVGRLDSNKDPLTVIKAFHAFIKQQPGAKLYMIYHTEELKDQITGLIRENKFLQPAVSLVGKVSHAEMQYWYNSADFIISGSHHEGSGIAVCEAMSCSCVPILTDIPSFRRMTGPGKCGLLYEAGNSEALLKTLLQTLDMDMEKERARVLQQFKTELSFEAIAKKINRVIGSI